MSALDAAIAQAKELLADLGPVSHRKMFGGAGLYLDGAMFALIAFEEIYLKAEGDLAAALESEGSSPFTYEGKDKPMTMSYWRLPDAALDDPDAAVAWARRAVDLAQAAKAKKKPPKKKPVKKPVKKPRTAKGAI